MNISKQYKLPKCLPTSAPFCCAFSDFELWNVEGIEHCIIPCFVEINFIHFECFKTKQTSKNAIQQLSLTIGHFQTLTCWNGDVLHRIPLHKTKCIMVIRLFLGCPFITFLSPACCTLWLFAIERELQKELLDLVSHYWYETAPLIVQSHSRKTYWLVVQCHQI